MQTKISKSPTLKATETLFTDDRKPWVTKISHAGLTRRFFKIGTQDTDIAIIKKVPFFSKNTEIAVKLRPFSRPARDAAYAEKDTLLPRNFSQWWQHNGSSGTPGMHSFLHAWIEQILCKCYCKPINSCILLPSLYEIFGIELGRLVLEVSNQFKKGKSRLFLTPVLTLWGGGHFDCHVWRRVIVPLDLAQSFGANPANYRCRVFTAWYPKCVGDLSKPTNFYQYRKSGCTITHLDTCGQDGYHNRFPL